MTPAVLRGIFTAVSLGLGSCIGLFSDETEPPPDTTLCAKANENVTMCVPGTVLGLPSDPKQCIQGTNCSAQCFADATCDELVAFFQGNGSSIAQDLENCTLDCSQVR